MKIHLNETELKQAIEQFIDNQGIDLSQREISIELTAGRGARGHYADIHLAQPGQEIDDNPFVEDDSKASKEDKKPEPKPDETGIDFG